MNIIKHDFIFESTLIQYNDRVGWLRANELYGEIYAGMHPNDKMTLNSTNLYFICKKPRLRVVRRLIIS